MTTGWDPASKSVIRNNGRNQGNNIWDQDAVSGQVIDSQGHDTNDQTLADSITDTLNINGINAMLANLDVGTFKVINLAPGVTEFDAVNFGQLDAVSGGVIDSQSWDGTNFITQTALNTFSTPIALMNSVKSGGLIRHHSEVLPYSANVTANTAAASRFRLACDGPIALTITPPSGVDPELGTNWEQEGQILVTNGATPGSITINGGGVNVKGSQDVTPNATYLLSYIQHYNSGAINSIFLWGT